MPVEHVEDPGEWEGAWDHLRVDGFLGTRMTLAAHLGGWGVEA